MSVSSKRFRSPRFLSDGPSRITHTSSSGGGGGGGSSSSTAEGVEEISLSDILTYTRKYRRQAGCLLNKDKEDDYHDHGSGDDDDDDNDDDDSGSIKFHNDVANDGNSKDFALSGGREIGKVNSEKGTNFDTQDVDHDNHNHNDNHKSPKKTHPNDVDMDRAIRMLEPHLINFRKSCKEDNDDNDDDGNDDGNDDDNEYDESLAVNNIPPSLIRVARFFPFKWIPIKKALLRRPSPVRSGVQVQSEVEIDVATRLSLANALYQKGILAGAELSVLEEAVMCQRHKLDNNRTDTSSTRDDNTSSTSTSSRKRQRTNENNEMYDKLRITFSRLPIDLASSSISITDNNNINTNTAVLSLRHLRTVIDEYCSILQKRDSNNNHVHENRNDHDDNSLPPLHQVADWALVSFSAVVVSNGFDDLRVGSDQYQREFKLVATLHEQQQQQQSSSHSTPTSLSTSDATFSNAMMERIKELMEPPALGQASNLNYFCLVRYLSYLPTLDVENIFRYSIDKSFHCGSGVVGLSSLPKLLASYGSAASRKRGFVFEDFEANLRKGLESTSNESGKQQEMLSYFNLLLQSTKFLLKKRH